MSSNGYYSNGIKQFNLLYGLIIYHGVTSKRSWVFSIVYDQLNNILIRTLSKIIFKYSSMLR